MGTRREPEPPKSTPPGSAASVMAALQCFAAVAATLIGYELGETLPAKLVAALLSALMAAFLTAPGGHRRRRLVAVGLFVAVLSAVWKRPMKAKPKATTWAPNSWVIVCATATAGLALGTAITAAQGGFTDRPAQLASNPDAPRAAAPTKPAAATSGAGCTIASTGLRVGPIPGWSTPDCKAWVPDEAGWYPNRTDFVIGASQHPDCGWLSQEEFQRKARNTPLPPYFHMSLSPRTIDSRPALRAIGTDPVESNPYAIWTVKLKHGGRLCLAVAADQFVQPVVPKHDVPRWWSRTVEALDALAAGARWN